MLGLTINLANVAISQYADWDFNSFAKIGDNYVGANRDGLFTMGGDTDNGAHIEAICELVLSDFGISNNKRLRKMYVGYEAAGDLRFTIKNDDGNDREYTLPTIVADQIQHGSRFAVGRDGKGRYWAFRIENTDGCDFGLDHIELIPVVLHRKPMGVA